MKSIGWMITGFLVMFLGAGEADDEHSDPRLASMPTVVLSDTGDAARPENGYPERLLTPGWEGNTTIKWIRRIEVSDRPFMTREETARYTEPIRSGKARQFSFIMDARPIDAFPASPTVVEKGWIEIRGIAWSGRAVSRALT